MALELAQWRMFLAVAERGSLNKAAQELRTDQPALSRSLRRLERQLGASLFDRSSRGLTLTEFGRRLQQPAVALITQADAVEAQAHADARQTVGVLRIGAIDAYPINLAIADACRDLVVAGRPIATEAVSLGWLAHPPAVLDRTIDIGFTLSVDGQTPESQMLRTSTLWEDTPGSIAISDRHPLAASEIIDPRDLADLPLHLPDKAGNPQIYNLMLEVLADAGLQAPRRAEPLGTMAAVIAQIASGNGWTVTTRFLARHLPQGIVAKPIEIRTRRELRFELMWHVNTDPATVTAFTEKLRAAIG